MTASLRRGVPWAYPLLLSVLVVAVTSLPYLVGAATEGSAHYTGSSFNYQDHHVYLAMMRQGATGTWLYRLAYTSEPHPGAAIYGFWLLLGHLARVLQAEPVLVFHAMRVIDSLFMFGAAWWLIRRLWPREENTQRTAFALVALASGLGWLGLLLRIPAESLPDVFMPEAIPFYTALVEPHYPLALGLMCLITGLIVVPGTAAWEWVVLALLSPALAEVKPYPFLVLFLALALYLAVRGAMERRVAWPVAWRAVVSGLTAAPVMVYQYTVAYGAPVIADWWSANVLTITSPPIGTYLLAYAWLLPCVLLAVVYLRRELRMSAGAAPWSVVYLLCWVVANTAWLYIGGVVPQRTFALGLHVPLALLAAVGWHRVVAPSLSDAAGRRLRRGWLAASMITNALLVTGLTLLIMGRASPLFLQDDEWQGLLWLRAHAPPGALVLAGVETSVYLPAWTDTRVIAGHPDHTVDAAAKEAALRAFYLEPEDPSLQAALLRHYSPRYIWYGPREQALGAPLPRLGSEWVEVFAHERVHIWEHVGSTG